MKKILYIILSSLVISSCVKEDYFGLSSTANVLNLQVANQADQAEIDNETHHISLTMTPGGDISESIVQILELSSFTTADKQVGDTLNLNQQNTMVLTAEDGTVVNWTIEAKYASEEPQLANSDFNLWYQTAGSYYEPGSDAENTIWCTGNAGSALLGKYASTPYEKEVGDYAVRLETLDNGPLSTMFGAPISAGSIITGEFNTEDIDTSNPRAAIDFGTLFTGRPKSLNITYSYVPGEVNKNKAGSVLDYGDSCDIYAILEVRSGDEVKRLATAWFRSGDVQAEAKDIELTFTYGELDESFPDYMKPTNGLYVDADLVDYALPTHIIFVASSSYNGDNFAGAVGSLLFVDDLKLNY
ncbi:MAG: PCMD domain-containing protein [Mangrovibacterium sp.]